MSDAARATSRQRRLGLGALSDAQEPERKGITRREELLSIAAELFAARGFASVTVGEIGARAGVSGPALYHHFESKEAILGEVLIDISSRLLEAGRALRNTLPPQRLLDDLIEMHVDFAVDHRALITIHFVDLDRASREDQHKVRRLQRQYVEIWVEALLARCPGLSVGAARAAVHAVFGLINSTPFIPRLRRSDLVALLRSMARASLAELDAPARASRQRRAGGRPAEPSAAEVVTAKKRP